MVILVMNIKTSELHIIKIYENGDDEKHVYKIHKLLNEEKCCAYIQLRDSANSYPFLIFECLGPDLEFLFNKFNKSFSKQTIMLIGY